MTLSLLVCRIMTNFGDFIITFGFKGDPSQKALSMKG